MISLTTVFYMSPVQNSCIGAVEAAILFMVDTSGDLIQSLDVNWVKENKQLFSLNGLLFEMKPEILNTIKQDNTRLMLEHKMTETLFFFICYC